MLKSMMFGDAWVVAWALERGMACRKEPPPLALVLVTIKVRAEGNQRSSRGSGHRRTVGRGLFRSGRDTPSRVRSQRAGFQCRFMSDLTGHDGRRARLARLCRKRIQLR